MQPKFAVFDIDGTLIRWQLYHAVADELARRGHLDPIAFQKVRSARMTWKKRISDTSFRDYEQSLVQLIDKAMTGITVKDFNAASQVVISEYKDQVYTFTRDLIRSLKNQGYLIFAISASQQEIVALLAEYYDFDDYAGSEYEIHNGRYSGKKQVLKRERKPEQLRRLVTKHQATWQDSIAVGDSESDILMLEAVNQPIAFNPTKALFKHAQARQWKIVLERKNVIYELESDDGSYLLVQTNA